MEGAYGKLAGLVGEHGVLDVVDEGVDGVVVVVDEELLEVVGGNGVAGLVD